MRRARRAVLAPTRRPVPPRRRFDRARRIAHILQPNACSPPLGGALYGPTLFALTRFHHRLLIAMLAGAEAALLCVPMAALALLLCAGLARLTPLARRLVAVRLRGPLSLYAAGWCTALGL